MQLTQVIYLPRYCYCRRRRRSWWPRRTTSSSQANLWSFNSYFVAVTVPGCHLVTCYAVLTPHLD